ncbi:MAG TPA: S-layer homology domain-containing protein, partial [Armatimonadetes bacterium]|nr:S-layer homology domain-containing protein [Armatimonadota bacterium]
PEDAWWRLPAQRLAAAGIVPPEVTKFRGPQPATRLEIAIWTARFIGTQRMPKRFHASFRDLRGKQAKYVLFLADLGLLEGYVANTFQPTRIINRYEAALFMHRLMVYLRTHCKPPAPPE